MEQIQFNPGGLVLPFLPLLCKSSYIRGLTIKFSPTFSPLGQSRNLNLHWLLNGGLVCSSILV